MDAARTNCRLPSWWRYTLVALATLILCSCQALPPGLNQRDPFANETATDELEDVITDGPAPLSPASPRSAEVRTLDAELLDVSLPMSSLDGMPDSGWATCSD